MTTHELQLALAQKQVRHLPCGNPLRWRFSTETTPGGPYCDHCRRMAPADEVVHTGPVCLASE